MSQVQSTHKSEFPAPLIATARSSEIAQASDVYGWLVGDWDLEVLRYRAVDVAARRIMGEVHAGWALEGRAVQDVWIMPRRADRKADDEKNINMYGTTLRVWDSSIQAWRITWINPVHNHVEHQIGRLVGTDIIQIGARPDGTPTRWRFVERGDDSFHWLGEALNADGASWRLEGEFQATRSR